MSNREVTEQDFRMPEFRNAKVEDYEFRADGKLVRKDRWEQGIQSIRFLVGFNGREFEIPEVVGRVRQLAADSERMWEAGAVLLRTIYESGIAYDNPDVEAALAAFATRPTWNDQADE